tara:strand:+ start:24 stop:260 length:237 start_codon:yes stop_codon:yes gene_type:complete
VEALELVGVLDLGTQEQLVVLVVVLILALLLEPGLLIKGSLVLLVVETQAVAVEVLLLLEEAQALIQAEQVEQVYLPQ